MQALPGTALCMTLETVGDCQGNVYQNRSAAEKNNLRLKSFYGISEKLKDYSLHSSWPTFYFQASILLQRTDQIQYPWDQGVQLVVTCLAQGRLEFDPL